MEFSAAIKTKKCFVQQALSHNFDTFTKNCYIMIIITFAPQKK